MSDVTHVLSHRKIKPFPCRCGRSQRVVLDGVHCFRVGPSYLKCSSGESTQSHSLQAALQVQYLPFRGRMLHQWTQNVVSKGGVHRLNDKGRGEGRVEGLLCFGPSSFFFKQICCAEVQLNNF